MRHGTTDFRKFFLSSIKIASYITFRRGDQTFSFFLTHAPVLPKTVIKATEEINNKLPNKFFQDDAKQSLPERLKAAIDALDTLAPEEKETAIVEAKENSARYALLWARFKDVWYLPETKNIQGDSLSTRIFSLYDESGNLLITGESEQTYLTEINDAIDAKFEQNSQQATDFALKLKALNAITALKGYPMKDDAEVLLHGGNIAHPVNSIELNQEMIEMAKLTEGKTYWVHGHTDSEGDSKYIIKKHIINLNNDLGKFPPSNIGRENGETSKLRKEEKNKEATFCKRPYSTLVIHNGDEHEAKKPGHTQYKNIWADLEQHPDAEKSLDENKAIDQTQLGVQAMAEGDTLVLGDMHANALRLVYHLIKHGIFVDVSEETYNQIRNCYHAIDSIYTQSNRNITWEIGQQLEAQYEIFYSLIDSLQIRETAIHLHLLGDLLCDRGVSDELIRTVLWKLKKNTLWESIWEYFFGNGKKINLSIQASNHGKY